jgi:hypothetical protein
MRPRLAVTAVVVLVALVAGGVTGARLRQAVAPVSPPWSASLYAAASDVLLGQGGAPDQAVVDVELAGVETQGRITAMTLSGVGGPGGRSVTIAAPSQVERRPGSPGRELFRLLVPLPCLAVPERHAGMPHLTVTVERPDGAMATSSTAVQNWAEVAPWCPQPAPAGGWSAPATLVDFVADPAHLEEATLRVSGLPHGQLSTGQSVEVGLWVELVGTPPGDGSATLRLQTTGCETPGLPAQLGLALELIDSTGAATTHYLRVGPQLVRWLVAYQLARCR